MSLRNCINCIPPFHSIKHPINLKILFLIIDMNPTNNIINMLLLPIISKDRQSDKTLKMISMQLLTIASMER